MMLYQYPNILLVEMSIFDAMTCIYYGHNRFPVASIRCTNFVYQVCVAIDQ